VRVKLLGGRGTHTTRSIGVIFLGVALGVSSSTYDSVADMMEISLYFLLVSLQYLILMR